MEVFSVEVEVVVVLVVDGVVIGAVGVDWVVEEELSVEVDVTEGVAVDDAEEVLDVN